MADLKRFLDFPGLEEYDRLIKEYIKTGSTDNIEVLKEELASLTQVVDGNKAAIAVLNGDDKTEGSVAKQVKDAIDALVNNAPEALDTLKEIADWIADDTTGVASLVSRVSDNEQKIEDLKDYVDAQDKDYFDAIQAIEHIQINSLFPIKQAEGQSAVAAIAAMKEGQALELAADQVIAEDIVIDKPCFIDANGSTFEGQVTVPANVDVIIENAVFAQPVVVA